MIEMGGEYQWMDFSPQVNITVRYPVMVVKDFFGGVSEKILFMNVDIKTAVPLIKINEINVDIVDGSMSIISALLKFMAHFFLGNVFEWG